MTDRILTCCDYVNQPYLRVRDAIVANPHDVFRRATAAEHDATLHVHVGGVDVGADIAIEVAAVEDDRVYDCPATKLTLTWQAAVHPSLFPAMTATLLIFPLSSSETQLELRGTYEPPLGMLGAAVDAVAAHRLAERSVTRFVQEVAGWLRDDLARPPLARHGVGT